MKEGFDLVKFKLDKETLLFAWIGHGKPKRKIRIGPSKTSMSVAF